MQPFLFGYMEKEGRAMLREWGHEGTLHLDETFGET
jgi:hypothetical protein